MKRWLKELDRLLRGEAARNGKLREDDLGVSVGGLLLVVLLLAALYGVCMGFFAGFSNSGPGVKQWCAGIVKVPALFCLTLLITFPSLYVFNALVGSRLTFKAIFQLIVATLAVNVAVLASLGPIVAFFSVSTTSYPFILLLNVAVFIVSGVFGFSFMLQILRRLTGDALKTLPPLPPPAEATNAEASTEAKPAVETPSVENKTPLWSEWSPVLDSRTKNIFVCWMIVSGLVCAQMSWVLRPLLGKPTEAFQWFCPRESSFFQAILEAIRNLFT